METHEIGCLLLDMRRDVQQRLPPYTDQSPPVPTNPPAENEYQLEDDGLETRSQCRMASSY